MPKAARTPHAVYLAIIATLIILLTYAGAKAVRAQRLTAELGERFGFSTLLATAPPRPEPLRPYDAAALLQPRSFAQYRAEVDRLIERAAALGEFGPAPRLAGACAAATAGGKRLRATVMLEVARMTSARLHPAHPVDAAEVAIFIEYVHAASLVVDDLPEFDNDPLRRGRPALHAAVGPAVAQLAALSLIAAAVQNVCRQVDWLNANAPEIRNADRIGVRLCSLVSRALGAAGAAGGQFMDIAPAEDRGTVEDILVLKTASLFEVAVAVGWLVAGGEFSGIDDCLLIGRKFGMAFQIADDVGDMAKDAARATAARPDPNYANKYGRDVAEADIRRHLDGAALLLERHGLWTPLWADEIYPAVHAMKASSTASGRAAPDTFGLGANLSSSSAP